MVDLTNPAAAHWLKQVIKAMLHTCGVSGCATPLLYDAPLKCCSVLQSVLVACTCGQEGQPGGCSLVWGGGCRSLAFSDVFLQPGFAVALPRRCLFLAGTWLTLARRFRSMPASAVVSSAPCPLSLPTQQPLFCSVCWPPSQTSNCKEQIDPSKWPCLPVSKQRFNSGFPHSCGLCMLLTMSPAFLLVL
jgi:hypothetical protein